MEEVHDFASHAAFGIELDEVWIVAFYSRPTVCGKLVSGWFEAHHPHSPDNMKVLNGRVVGVAPSILFCHEV